MQNGLQQRLPAEFLSSFPSGNSIAFSIVPEIASIAEPFRTEIRQAFAESLRTLWLVLIGISGLGLISSFAMKQLPLHTSVDKAYALEDRQPQSDSEDGQTRIVSGRATDKVTIASKRLERSTLNPSISSL